MKLKLFIAAFLIIGCQSKDANEGFIINGNIQGLDVQKVYMKYTMNGEEQSDTSIVKEGEFQFEGRTDEPGLVIIYSPEARFQKVFYLENIEMTISGSADSLNHLMVRGSQLQDEYHSLEESINKNREKATALHQKSVEAGKEGDTILMNQYEAQFTEAYNYEWQIKKQFIIDHPNSIVSINEMMNYANPKNYTDARKVFNGLSDEIKNSARGKEVETYLKNIGLSQPGQPAIAFEQEDVNGDMVSLESYKGKYVLVEFWASWCGPCRYENPNLRSEYQKYKDQGFDILGVSLDDDGEKWKKAIEKDSLTWVQVSDLKGWNNKVAKLYGIRAIPANFLISPEGQIVARDLRGDQLNEKLNELLN